MIMSRYVYRRPFTYPSRLAMRPVVISIPAGGDPVTPTTALLLPRSARPSYASGFARSAGESANPGLWRGLFGAWVPMLGNTGGILRDVVGGCHGTLTNMEPATDWVRNGLRTPGSDDTISIDTKDQLRDVPLGDWSVVLDVTPHELTVDTASLAWSGTDDLVFYVNENSGGGRIRIFWRDRGGSHHNYVTGPGHTNTRMHVVFTFDSVQETSWLYFNGVLVSTDTVFPNDGDEGPFTDVWISSFAGSQFADQTIHSIGVYSRVLQLNETQQLYADPLAPFRRKPLVISIPGDAGGDSSTGATSGTSTVEGEGLALATADGLTSGTATISGEGKSLTAGTGTSDGIAAVDGEGKSLTTGTGTSDGTATIDGEGSATATGNGTTSGVATVDGEGSAVIESYGESSGEATVSGEGGSTTTGNSTGTSTVSGEGSATASGDGSSIGTSTVDGESLSVSVGISDGISEVIGEGSSTVLAEGESSGIAIVEGDSSDELPQPSISITRISIIDIKNVVEISIVDIKNVVEINIVGIKNVVAVAVLDS